MAFHGAEMSGNEATWTAAIEAAILNGRRERRSIWAMDILQIVVTGPEDVIIVFRTAEAKAVMEARVADPDGVCVTMNGGTFCGVSPGISQGEATATATPQATVPLTTTLLPAASSTGTTQSSGVASIVVPVVACAVAIALAAVVMWRKKTGTSPTELDNSDYLTSPLAWDGSDLPSCSPSPQTDEAGWTPGWASPVGDAQI